ncbi:MAG: hypothetical protein ACREQL_11580, partial [Candidatus Binatia bacterium]
MHEPHHRIGAGRVKAPCLFTRANSCHRVGMEYRTAVKILGLPLVHVATGRGENGVYRRGIARGWIAVGDIAIGPLLAIGGISVGGLSLGGLAIGAVVVGGMAVGALAAGGLAIGILAVGGAAFGLVGALGGLAVARDVALGGVAVATHANDAVAREMVAHGTFFRAADTMLRYSILLVALPTLMGL